MDIWEGKQESDLAMFSYCTGAIAAKVQNIFDCNFYKLIPETHSIFLVSRSKVLPALENLHC